jgi:hypothetical protein
MMAACVIDASVAIKWVITEDGTDAADQLRGLVSKGHFARLNDFSCAAKISRRDRSQLSANHFELGPVCPVTTLAGHREARTPIPIPVIRLRRP